MYNTMKSLPELPREVVAAAKEGLSALSTSSILVLCVSLSACVSVFAKLCSRYAFSAEAFKAAATDLQLSAAVELDRRIPIPDTCDDDCKKKKKTT